MLILIFGLKGVLGTISDHLKLSVILVVINFEISVMLTQLQYP